MGSVLAFLLTNLPLILCLLAGVTLLVVEVFVPGFGVPGIAGLVLLTAGIAITWVHYGVAAGLAATLLALVLAGISISVSIKSAANGKISRSTLILRRETPENDHEEMTALVGKEGKATTALRPVGMAELDGVRLEVFSEDRFIEVGTPVRVIRAEGNKIIVRAV